MATAAAPAHTTAPEMDAAEWEARQQLAACYRVFDMLGWSEMIYNHITLRVPGEEGAFLINPFGLHFSEVTASSLVKIDLDGNALAPTRFGVNKAGFVQHSAFHRALPDAHCIMHTHTTAGAAIASLEGGLSLSNFYAGQLAPQLAYHDFEGITVRGEEGERLVGNMHGKSVMILRNHGLLSLGKTLPEAFLKLWLLQRACEIQVAAGAAGGHLRAIPADVLAVHQRDSAQMIAPGGLGAPDFAAMVRLVDRRDPSWRE